MDTRMELRLLGRTLTLQDIENITSPALRAILLEQLLKGSEQYAHSSHTKYTDYTKYSKYDRFAYCGVAPGD